MKITLIALLAAVLPFASVHAQTAGDLVVRGGVTSVRPNASSADMSPPSPPGAKISVGNATQAMAGVTYYITENLALDAPISASFRHDIRGAGILAGAGKLGEVKSLPIVLLLQYRAGDATSSARPFVGVGMTYAYTTSTSATPTLSAISGGTPTNPTRLEMDHTAGPSVQLGISAKITASWSVEASVMKSRLKADGRLSTGPTLEVTLKPTVSSVALTYKF